jgi:hypothetical protein
VSCCALGWPALALPCRWPVAGGSAAVRSYYSVLAAPSSELFFLQRMDLVFFFQEKYVIVYGVDWASGFANRNGQSFDPSF